MKKKFLILLSILIISSMFATPVAAGGPGFKALQPGEFVVFEQDVPINLVFVGYDGMIDEGDLLGQLPATYEPVVRYPQFYGLPGRPLGLKFNFDYNVIYAGPTFEKRFFKYVQRIGEPGDPTYFQQLYNDQENNVLDVTDPVLYVDAPSVENWLWTRGGGLLGIDTRHSYTIYFINWYGRDDFQFHVYTKTDEPDPDTGYNFGEMRSSRKMIAWGGSHGRTWFYDLSAGPEAWTDNWNVDEPDLDDNGYEDYRMPPIWEYTPGGYRDPSALSSDLGLVTRFVGINLLFTTSPLYDPLVTAPGRRGDKVVHIEMFEDDPGSSGLDWINTDHIYDKLYTFQPYYRWQVNLEDNDPMDPGAERAFRIFTGLLAEDDCWVAYGTPFAQLFCYFNANLGLYVPPYGPTDYVGEVFAFNTTDDNMGDQWGLLGFADDDWMTGTQSYVFQFDTEFYRYLGYGFSDTTVHEFGHHIGMSHPHDGYDSEYGFDYGPGDSFYFAWSGDESNTVMHYLGLSSGFGQFDQDNMYRYEMAGYLNWANDLLDDVVAHPKAYKVKGLLKKAEKNARRAMRNWDNWNYRQAVRSARQAYGAVAIAAMQLGIPTTTTSAFTTLSIPNASVPHEGDPIRYPDN